MIKNKKGFTLIELIIVMTIIGILAVVAIVAISGKSADARDARRLADMSAVQTGLALYCYEQGNAGSSTDVTGCTAGGAAGDETILSTCSNLTQIALKGVNDPSPNATDACTDNASAVCNYGVTVGTGTTFNSCNYHIYAWLEAGELLHVTQAGMTRS